MTGPKNKPLGNEAERLAKLAARTYLQQALMIVRDVFSADDGFGLTNTGILERCPGLVAALVAAQASERQTLAIEGRLVSLEKTLFAALAGPSIKHRD